ncbi:CvfB family protein [Rubellicoccus peritrichatus]|uniref:S1-like domain-containing RNA-binding protein n=1 Tax=Rubellicoccus peritrichatus TaxID=3080537 RepID=A0AAQ3LAR2_9BACT|nr:S1-like domain-containing RNA-binding protein [Puniceicoccus sp. CR14]WOO42231.1 S1-like domain-containing RNA-binding protein [Puniceicoccus sp. CR14]
MVAVGEWNRLVVMKIFDRGIYVDGDWLGDILLPRKEVPEGCKLYDELNVFLYFDSEDRIIATMQTPKAVAGEVTVLEVVSVGNYGAFLDWGLAKDILVPFREQRSPMKVGEKQVVVVFYDERSGRLVASSKLNKFLQHDPIQAREGDAVDLIICHETDIGRNAVINGTHWGLIHKGDIFEKLTLGDKVTGYIKKIREDGKVDLSLKKLGYGKVSGLAGEILDALDASNGFIPLNDKSSPEAISQKFGASKKAYKMAIGKLYKQELIKIEPDGIRLVGVDS